MASNIMYLVILLLYLVMSVTGKEFISYDCGASATYTDDKGIVWSPDDAYIDTGESRRLPYSFQSRNNTKVNTLRVFKTSIKSCYYFYGDKGEQILFRATFAYGNYDYAYASPTFDLQLNGTYWATVVGKISTYSTYEAILIANGGVISVCLVRTIDGQYPFISALELRTLDANIYRRTNSNRALYLAARFIGSNSLTVRYPDDPYDRIWKPTTLTPTSSSDTLGTINIKLEDKPPVAALEAAVTSYDTSTPIAFRLSWLPLTEVPILMNMYFVELDKLHVSDKRSFNVYVDSKLLTSTPITPSYGIASELTFTNILASATTAFYLKATSDSTQPPIINALEIFTFGGGSENNNDKGSGGTGNGNGNGNGDSNNNNNGPGGTGKGNRSGGSKKNNTGIIVGITVPIFILVWAIVGGMIIWQRKKKAAIDTAKTGNIEMAENEGDTMPNDTSER